MHEEEKTCERYEQPYLVLDVRAEADFAACHLVQARNFPQRLLMQDKSTAELHQFKNKEGKLIILYDADERLAAAAAHQLTHRGFENVFVLSGGLNVFVDRFPVCRGHAAAAAAPPDGASPRAAARRAAAPRRAAHRVVARAAAAAAARSCRAAAAARAPARHRAPDASSMRAPLRSARGGRERAVVDREPARAGDGPRGGGLAPGGPHGAHRASTRAMSRIARCRRTRPSARRSEEAEGPGSAARRRGDGARPAHSAAAQPTPPSCPFVPDVDPLSRTPPCAMWVRLRGSGEPRRERRRSGAALRARSVVCSPVYEIAEYTTGRLSRPRLQPTHSNGFIVYIS